MSELFGQQAPIVGFVLAGLIGFLVGRTREDAAHIPRPGIRDFTIIALLGAMAGPRDRRRGGARRRLRMALSRRAAQKIRLKSPGEPSSCQAPTARRVPLVRCQHATTRCRPPFRRRPPGAPHALTRVAAGSWRGADLALPCWSLQP
jgi:hypothetical protein